MACFELSPHNHPRIHDTSGTFREIKPSCSVPCLNVIGRTASPSGAWDLLEGYSQDEGKTLVAIRTTPSQIVPSKEAKFKAFEPQLHEQLYELGFSVLKCDYCDLAKLFCWSL